MKKTLHLSISLLSLLLLVTGKISTDLTPNMKTACPNAGIAHF